MVLIRVGAVALHLERAPSNQGNWNGYNCCTSLQRGSFKLNWCSTEMEKKLGRGAGGKECNEYWIDCIIIIIIITTSFIYVWKWGEVWSGALHFVENERERERVIK